MSLSPAQSPTRQVVPEPQSGRWRQLRAVLDPATTVGALLAGFITAAVVFVVLRRGLASDFDPHVGMTADALDSGAFPGNFLFYVLNAALAGFTTSYWALKLSLVLVVGAATVGKAWLSMRFIAVESDWRPKAAGRASGVLLAVLGVLLTLVFSLPGDNRYLGQIPPNVWHNTTTIVSMPFAILLYWVSLQYLRTADTKWLRRSVLVAAFVIAAKPSFVLCFIPVFPLAALARFGWRPEFWKAIVATGACGLLLLAQYIYIYVMDPTSEAGASSGVAISAFNVWHVYSSNIPYSLLLSLAFPLTALLLGGRAIRQNDAVRYAGVLFAVGVIEFSLLTETGLREFDGNFSWQAIITNYILFLSVAAALVPQFREGLTMRRALIAVAFLAHVVAAGLYLDHWNSTASFI